MEQAITDYHGTLVTVEEVHKSAGAFVYLELDGPHGEAEFARLTPQQAVRLSVQLRNVATEILLSEGGS